MLDDIKFTESNNKYCIFEHEPLNYSKYLTKLYIGGKKVTLDE